MPVHNIHTDRLILVPFTLAVAKSLMPGGISMLRDIGLRPTCYWPDQETVDTLPRIIKSLEKVPEPTGFESWMIVLKENSTVIGDAGFKGAPNKEGAVDIGYSIIEQEQRRGYGLETAKALIHWAFQQPTVSAVTAKCLVENEPSAKILEKLGMQELVRDDEMIYWKLSKPEPAHISEM